MFAGGPKIIVTPLFSAQFRSLFPGVASYVESIAVQCRAMFSAQRPGLETRDRLLVLSLAESSARHKPFSERYDRRCCIHHYRRASSAYSLSLRPDFVRSAHTAVLLLPSAPPPTN